jgi:apolipoprotein N-acyltransferase
MGDTGRVTQVDVPPEAQPRDEVEVEAARPVHTDEPAARRSGRWAWATRWPALRRRWPYAAAAGSGAVLMFAFPSYDLWWLAPFAVAALVLLCRGRSARAGLGLGFAFGLGFFVPLLSWTGVYVGPAPWLLLAVAEAAIFAPAGLGLALATRVPAWPLTAGAVWVADEAIRDRGPYGGFPWGRLAFSQAPGPYLKLAALGGAPLVTFAVAATGALLAAAVVAGTAAYRNADRRRRYGLLAGVAAAAGLAVALAGLAVPLPAPTGSVTVAVVQGNVPRLGLDFNSQKRAVLANHVARTEELAGRIRRHQVPKPAFVIWPENSSDISPFDDPTAYAMIDKAVRDVGVPVLIGTILDGPGRYISNTGIVWDPKTGPGARYTKRHPVPFGEYIPFRSIARQVSSAVDRVHDFKGGSKPGVLRMAGTPVGDVICFEVAYDNLVRDAVKGGGQVLVVQTNNATFGHTDETWQQLAMARLRAVESDRSVLVAATSGASAVIDTHGTVTWHSRVFTPAVKVATVATGTRHTLATRVGAGPEWVIAGIGALGILAALRRRRTRQTAHPTTLSAEVE